MTLKFHGLFEPHEVMTGDRRAFKSMSLTNRDLPLPLMMRSSSGGHSGAELIGSITKIQNGPKGRWYSGNFLDPAIVPEVAKAIYLTKKKLVGPSVDLDRSFTVEPRMHSDGKPMAYFTSGNVIGVTLVPMPAFADVTFEVMTDDPEDLVESLQASGVQAVWTRGTSRDLRGVGITGPLPSSDWILHRVTGNFAVSQANWDGIPVAPRDYTFDADDAVKRIAQWSGVGTPQADTNKYASMFLWRGGNQTGDTLAQEDFRMPIGDIINGEPHLVFHAIYAAAALLSGAHGGLPNVPDEEKNAIKGVINQIYPRMAQAFGDETMHSPFVAGDGGQHQMSQPVEEFASKPKAEPYGDVEYADPGYRDNKKRYPINTPDHIRAAWAYVNVAKNAAFYTAEQLKAIKDKIKSAAKKMGIEISDESDESSEMSIEALEGYADLNDEDFAAASEPYGDVEYADPGYRDNKKRYPLDSEAHCRAAWAYVNMPKNAALYTPEQLKHVRGKIITALKKYGVDVSEKASEMASEMALVFEDDITEFAIKSANSKRPSLKAFDDPRLNVPTPLTIMDDGRVFGHLGKWGECHIGIGDKCVLLPKSRTNYQLFKSGTVKTAEGVDVHVGKITLGTAHAHPTYGIVPSREHYDNSGWCAAVVNVGEDSHGVWVSGVLTDFSKADELRRSPLSGDWRRYNGNLELVAALAVNNPGFPVFHVQESEEFSLCAAGIVEHPMFEIPAEFADQPPQSLYTLIDYDDVVAEVTATLIGAQVRTERLRAIREATELHLQTQRARRFAAITGEEITPASKSMPPVDIKKPMGGQDMGGDGEIDPDADPNTPGIAEVDDPGRETLMARMRSGRYVVVEEPEEVDETQPQKLK